MYFAERPLPAAPVSQFFRRSLAAKASCRPLDFFSPKRHNGAVIKLESRHTMDKKTELWRSLKFFLFSVSAGIIEIVTFALLNETLGWPYWPCYLIALVLSVLWNFTLNRRYTFRSANNVPVAMAKVFLFYLIFTPASTLFGNWLAEGLGWNEYLVTAINMALNFVLEYLYDRFFVFGDSLDTNSLAKKQEK